MWGRVRDRLPGPGPASAPSGRAWPVRLAGRTPTGIAVTLRPLVLADEPVFHEVRRLNAAWLEPWDATLPGPPTPLRGFPELVRHHEADAVAGRSLPFVVEVDRRLVGQISASTITLGSFRSCSLGYWVSRSVAGRMVIPTSIAMVGDHLFGSMGLHRIEVNIRPENDASLAVVRKLGFRDEGVRRRMLHIDGDWRDHRSFALTIEDLAGESFGERLVRLTGAPGADRAPGALRPGRDGATGSAPSAHVSHESLQRHTGDVPRADGGAVLPS